MASATTETQPDVPQTAEEAAAQAAQEWKMPPEVGLGSKILFAADSNEMAHPGLRGRYMGFIVKMGRRAVDVLCLVPGGFREYINVRYVDDPLVAQNPQWFIEGDTGVFCLADSEVKLQELQTTVNILQASMASLLADKGKSKKP